MVVVVTVVVTAKPGPRSWQRRRLAGCGTPALCVAEVGAIATQV